MGPQVQARAGGSDQQQGPPSTYLGLVLAIEDLSIYALITTTRLRILVVLRTPGGIMATSSSAGQAAGASTGASSGANAGGIAAAHGASADVRLRDLDILTVSYCPITRGQASSHLSSLPIFYRFFAQSIPATWPTPATHSSRSAQQEHTQKAPLQQQQQLAPTPST